MKLPRPARAIVAASIAGGVGTLIIAGIRQSACAPVGESQWFAAAVLGVLLLGSWLWPLVVFRGGESEAAHVDECFFVILALLVPPVLTLGTLAVATTLAQVLRRRPLVKSAFNAGQVLVSAGLGLAVSRGIAVPSDSVGVAQVAAVVAGVAVFLVVNEALVSGVMAVDRNDLARVHQRSADPAHAGWRGALTGIVLALAIRAAPLGDRAGNSLADPRALAHRRQVRGAVRPRQDRRAVRGHAGGQPPAAAAAGSRHDPGVGPAAAPQPAGDADARRPAPGELSAAITIAGQQQWLVAAGRRRDEPFDDADHGLLRALAAVGNAALSNAELYQQVHVERERLSSITLNIGEGVCAIGADGRLMFVNPAAAELIELPPLNITATPGRGTCASPRRTSCSFRPARPCARGRTIREDDARFCGKNGRTVPVAYTASAVMNDGAPSGAVIAFRDITERKAFEDELHHHAFYDSLTGLANRRLLVERLEQALRRSALDRKTHALIFIDVDRFKSINDSLGHVTGDKFLVAIGNR